MGEAHREGRDRDPTVVERREVLREAFAALAEEVILRHATAFERELVGVARSPSQLPVGGPTENPRTSAGTTTVDTPLAPASSSVRHATTTNPVIGVPLFVMNDFDPSITQLPPSSRAFVRSAPASDPPPAP